MYCSKALIRIWYFHDIKQLLNNKAKNRQHHDHKHPFRDLQAGSLPFYLNMPGNLKNLTAFKNSNNLIIFLSSQDFSILDKAANEFDLLIHKRLLLMRDHLSLKFQNPSVSLFTFILLELSTSSLFLPELSLFVDLIITINYESCQRITVSNQISLCRFLAEDDMRSYQDALEIVWLKRT